MKLGRLLDALHARHVGQHDGEQAGLIEQLESAPRGAFGEQLGQFVADALGRNLRDLRRQRLRRRQRCRARSRKPNRAANRTARIMRSLSSAKRSARIADGAHDSGAQIRAAVRQSRALRASPGSISRPLIVKSRRRTSSCGGIRIDHAVRVAAIGIADVGAERRHFDFARRLRHDQNHAEFRAHGKAARKQLLHALGTRVGGDVVIRTARGPAADRAHTRPPDRLDARCGAACAQICRPIRAGSCTNYAPV